MIKTKKSVLLGITGSIAAYKMADVASLLTREGYNVETIMTENATKIIRPIVFSTLSGNRCITETFDETIDYDVAHVSLAKKTDLILVAPATANIIAKLANGIADDMLTTTVLACNCKKLISPAMNTQMYENPIVQDNLRKLKKYGWKIIEPESGILACKDEGKGRLPKVERLIEEVKQELYEPKDLEDVNVLISAGPTREAIDPVRYISNNSSGKMGYALAEAAADRGANVILVSGPTNLDPPPNVKRIDVKSASEMAEEIFNVSDNMDIIIKAAAVADFTPEEIAKEKLKKEADHSVLKLTNTIDILKTLGERKKDGQFLCGFSMESENVIENSRKKLDGKNADLICANSIKDEGAGFREDTNIVTLISRDDLKSLEKMSKVEAAHKIIDEIINLKNSKKVAK